MPRASKPGVKRLGANSAGVQISALHVEAEQGDESGALAKAALFCLAVAVAIVLAGFYGLGRSGMLDMRSPDFVPVPHFFAFAAICLALFFFVRAYLHGSRYRLFGTSVVEGNTPVLGEPFAGTLRIAKADALTAPISLTLRCDWRHFQSDSASPSSSGSTVTQRLWEQSQELQPAGAGSGQPFRFDLPDDGLPSGRRPKPKTGVHPESPGDIVWTLRASSPRWGTDYVAEFEIDVRPGRLIRALSKEQKATPPDDAPGDPASPALRTMAALGGASALLFGGNVPTAAELREEAEADARTEPAAPFAKSGPLEQSGERFLRIGTLIATLFLSVVAGASLVREASFGWRGVEMPSVVVKAETRLVTLNFGPDDPAHTISVSSHHHWTPGEPVVALCQTGEDGRRRCRMQSGLDRWLDGLGTLGLALAAFAVWSYLRRRSFARSMKGT
jgi:hypothetical protein